MSASDVLAVIAATVVVMLVTVLGVVLVTLARTLRDLRATVTAFQEEAVGLLDEARVAVADAAGEVERIDRLLGSAERLDDAKRALATPMVKAMAFGSGVSRAAQRLRTSDQSPRKSAS